MKCLEEETKTKKKLSELSVFLFLWTVKCVEVWTSANKLFSLVTRGQRLFPGRHRARHHFCCPPAPHWRTICSGNMVVVFCEPCCIMVINFTFARCQGNPTNQGFPPVLRWKTIYMKQKLFFYERCCIPGSVILPRLGFNVASINDKTWVFVPPLLGSVHGSKESAHPLKVKA